MKLLIVDDHALMREVIREMVGGAASEFRECASGEEAIALCASYAPDLVTIDLRMTTMDGLTAVQHIRELHPNSHIVVVTVFDHDVLRTRAQRAGANRFFAKSDIAQLKQYITSLANLRGPVTSCESPAAAFATNDDPSLVPKIG